MLKESLSVQSSFQSIMQLLKDSADVYDIAAACYYTIMQSYHNRDYEFITIIDTLPRKVGKQVNTIVETFRKEISGYVSSFMEDHNFQLLIYNITNCLGCLNDDPKSNINDYILFCAFYIIQLIDMAVDSKQKLNAFAFPDHGPLNKNVCKDKCYVYYNEHESFLQGIYNQGKTGFRRPLVSVRLGSIFQNIMLFECIDFIAAPPKIVPIFPTRECIKYLKEEQCLKIASIPFIGFQTIEFWQAKDNTLCENLKDLKGEFYIKYNQESEKDNITRVTELLQSAVANKANIIVFPEYIMSPNMLDAISEQLSDIQQKRCDNFERVIAVFAGTSFEYYDSNKSNNVLHILKEDGQDIGARYYKFSPFLTQANEFVHGADYGSAEPKGFSGESAAGEENIFNNWELLSDRGKECTLIDIDGVGRVLPAICRDVIDGLYTDTLAKLFMPSLIMIPAWSSSVNSFRSRLSVLAETIHTSSLLCNCCNAVKDVKGNIDDKQNIGMFVYPTKPIANMIAEVCPLNRSHDCYSKCKDIAGCIHFIDLSWKNGFLSVNKEQICVQKSDLA